MTIDKAIQLAERYDQALIKMEDAAIERMNKALDTAFKQLDRELTKNYDSIASNATILQAQRKALILQQLGSLLKIVRPQDAKMYQIVLQNLINNSIDAGADLGGSLIRTINPAVDVKPFAEVPIEAVASASKNAYERLQRHGETFASTATAIIDQGLIQGWGIQKIRQPLQQQLGVTKSRAEMIARTETIAAYNDAADQRYADAEIEGVLWIAIGDKRTCFPAGTFVKTIDGERPIESIKKGDKVLTRFGYRRVVKTLSRPYCGEFTRLQLSDRSLVSTSNHPIWTTKGWTQAGKIKPGCVVKLDNKSLAQVLSVENFFISQSNQTPTTTQQECFFSSISQNILEGVKMPKRAVNLNGNLFIRNSKINAVPTDSKLLLEVDAQRLQTFSDNTLKTGFASIRAITGDVTKSSFVNVARHFSDCTVAVETIAVIRWSIALFRAVLIALATSKNFPASLAWLVLLWRMFSFAINRAKVVSVRNAFINNKDLGTAYTSFTYGDSFNACKIASLTAINSFSMNPFDFIGSENFTALFASQSLLSNSGKDIRLDNIKTCSRAILSLFTRFSIKSVAAGFTIENSHDNCIGSANYHDNNGQAQVSLSPIVVYNLTVEQYPEYYANGILVHNCPYCLSRHMKVYKRGSMRPPLHVACRCTLAPVNQAWIEAGIVDVNALRSERQRALEEATVDPKEEPAPFERAAGIKSLPKPIYIPVITVPPKPVITSGSAEMVTATPKAKTKRTPKPKQPSINYSVNRYNPEELIQLGAKFTEQNLKIPEISDRERQLEKALANARQKLQEEIQAGSPSPKTIDAFRKAENAYYKEQEKRQEAEAKEYDKLRQAIKKKHGELDAQALVDKINFQNLGEITTQTLKSTYQDFFELTGGKGARSIKTLKYDDPRAYASRYENVINIGKGAEKGTQFHEAGHHVEYESKDLQMAMNIWRNQRAYSLQYKSLKELTGIDYDDDEVALEDKYLDPYVGKVYANDSTEVLSMGIEHFTDAKAMRRLRETDKQHFDLIMGVILANEN